MWIAEYRTLQHRRMCGDETLRIERAASVVQVRLSLDVEARKLAAAKIGEAGLQGWRRSDPPRGVQHPRRRMRTIGDTDDGSGTAPTLGTPPK